MKQTTWTNRLKHLFIGRARELSDQGLFHKVSLIAVFAWVGLGADGLSSSCYGPEEAFKALGTHTHLVLLVALMSVLTVIVICASYAQIIEVFPAGGGGYVVASKLLSPTAGVVSGCALLIDYVLTIAISIASGADAIFSLLPEQLQSWKLAFSLAGLVLLTVLNLRGVKESVMVLVPIFFLFLITHAFIILYAFATHLSSLPEIAAGTVAEMRQTHSQLGLGGMLFLLLRAYSMGAGTYTGIEAVSNGLPILREPRVQTGKRTMRYMAVSLAATVAGLFIAYLLYAVQPQDGKTLNAVLFEKLTASWGASTGFGFVLVTLATEAALLFIAAQTGFLDGPRVLSNMALDRWFPARFAALSDRFVSLNGVLLMSGSALFVLLLSHGSVEFLLVLYSINVFITFSLSQLGMVRHWWQHRAEEPKWLRKLIINGIGLTLTTFILITLTVVKFHDGGWITLLITGALVLLALAIKRHYVNTVGLLKRLDEITAVARIETKRVANEGLAKTTETTAGSKTGKTAVILVNGFNGLGLHTLLNAIRLFGGAFNNFVFLQVGVVDAGNFKGTREIENLREHVARECQRYVEFMQNRGFTASACTSLGPDAVEEVDQLSEHVAGQYPEAVFFGGQLVFQRETFLTRFLHNYTVFALQRRFYLRGLPFVVLPIRVDNKAESAAA